MFTTITIALLSLFTFIAGLQVMRGGLEGMARGRLPAIVHRFVKTPTRGLFTGIIVTGLVQSSAAVTAITVGMVAGGTMAFRDAIGIILGSNVGSTVTPQLLTLNLWYFAVFSLFVGILFWFIRIPGLAHPSRALIGFASIFIALQCLTKSLHPLSQTHWFADILLQAGTRLWLAAIVGCVASAVIQSSTATTVITMALCAQGLVSPTSGIAIVLGANVGTCMTSVVAAMGQPRAAQQVAFAHVLLNVTGVLVFLPLISPFSSFLTYLSTNSSQEVANANTVFNLVCTCIAWPLTQQLTHLIEWLLPDNQYA